MGKMIDMTGWIMSEHGVPDSRIKVISKSEKNNQGRIMWLCECVCGNAEQFVVAGTHIRNGNTKSCGCLQKEVVGNMQLKNLIGQQFGELKVIDRAEKPKHIKDRSAYWKCLCSCGNEVIYSGHTLKIGKANSCGCLKSLGEQTITKLLKEPSSSILLNSLTQACASPPV